MKQLVVLAGCCVALFGLAGCQTAGRSERGVEVVIEGGGQFPEFFAGTWRAYMGDEKDWELVFERDGTLRSAVMSFGGTKLKPGQVTVVPMKFDKEGVFEPGEWIAHYDPSDRVLTVRISIKHFRIGLGPDIVVEGDRWDVFVGPVSEDGKTWLTERTSFTDYISHTPEHPYFRIAEEQNLPVTTTLLFEKVAPE